MTEAAPILIEKMDDNGSFAQAQQDVKPDLWWNPEDWETTHFDLSEAYEDATSGECTGIVRLSRAHQMPDVWAVQVEIDTTGDGEADDYELRTFPSKEAAEKYLAEATIAQAQQVAHD